MLEQVIFWTTAVLAVGGALGVVLHRSVVYAALFLIVVFLSIAVVFVLNNADFLAIAQTIVYGVGLTIVLKFGVMFTGDRPVKGLPGAQKMAYGLLSLMVLGVLAWGSWGALFLQKPIPADVVSMLQTEGSSRALGLLLFNKYLLPFELASLLLLVAMIGAIVIAKKSFTFEGVTPVIDPPVIDPTMFELNAESHVSAEAKTALSGGKH